MKEGDKLGIELGAVQSVGVLDGILLGTELNDGTEDDNTLKLEC